MRTDRVGSTRVMLMDAGEIPVAARAKSNEHWMRHQIYDVQAGNFGHSNFSIERFAELATLGDERYVAESEAYMQKIEDQVPVSRGWRNLDDVVGAVPNIPAYLAGHPQCMRRRERVARDNAPLTVFMDIASSMGIKSDQIRARGIVLLALVRRLVEHRPVELWVGTGLHPCVAAWRIDTAPIDLARAAFHIADTTMSRVFGYAMCETMENRHLGSALSPELTLSAARQVAGWGEVLFIPAIHLYDPMVKDPVGWLKKQMKQYIGNKEDE